MKALLLGCVLVAGQTEASAPKLQIDVPEAARVRSVHFRLGEIVAISGGSKELLEKASSILVGYSPSPGSERRMRRDSIGDLLVASGISRSAFRLTGASFASVTTESVAFDPVELLRKGESFLVAQVRDLGLPDFQIEANGTPASLLVPAGRKGVSLEAAFRGEPRLSGQVGVDLRILVDGEPFGVVPLVYTVRQYGIAAAAMRPIGAGEVLGPANVEFRRVEIPTGIVEAFFSKEQLVGREATRSIPAGEVITSAHVRSIPLVQKDQTVTVTVRGRGLSVALRGRCAAAGIYGAIVPVENPMSGKQIFGKVVGPGEVEIHLPGSK